MNGSELRKNPNGSTTKKTIVRQNNKTLLKMRVSNKVNLTNAQRIVGLHCENKWFLEKKGQVSSQEENISGQDKRNQS